MKMIGADKVSRGDDAASGFVTHYLAEVVL